MNLHGAPPHQPAATLVLQPPLLLIIVQFFSVVYQCSSLTPQQAKTQIKKKNVTRIVVYSRTIDLFHNIIAAHLFILLITSIYFLVINCSFLFYYFIIYLPIYFCSFWLLACIFSKRKLK